MPYDMGSSWLKSSGGGAGVAGVEAGLVSVVMPAHNAERFLSDSIRSVVAQSFSQWELLVVDDASTDQTFAIASDFAKIDCRIRVVRLEENRGVANARNVGIRLARGQFLAFLDSDDLWLPHKLEIQISYMRQKGVAFSFSSYRRLAPDGRLGSELRVPVAVTYKQLLKGNVIGCLTAVIDRMQIAVVNMEECGHEDYVAWLSILRKGHVAHGIQADLARYRLSSSSVSGNKRHSALWTWKIYTKVEKLSLPFASWCFVSYCWKSVMKRVGE
jgi:glycosyltransferase involved in cell wall biosynthesis